jgi:ATP-binding cassette subfamily C (CFTR/MRP) protein 1
LNADIIVVVAFSIIIFARGYISPAFAALTVTQVAWLPEIIYWVILSAASLENSMVSVERLESLIKVEGEAPRNRHKDTELANWPHSGEVVFKNFQMRYRDNTEIVLKGLSFQIAAKEKIGIVGRTGSGKSSIGVSLFRIVERYAGSIEIDGVDIADVGLDMLRSRLSLIPQDPALFHAPLRDNLDPFHNHSDSELSSVLSSIGMTEPLDKEITENGDNISVGERQLICIARAILRKSKIMLLDEATASIDLRLDEKIQGVIRKMFADCTVLTIAHRINTIMDYDKILVLEEGEIVEFDTPAVLMEAQGHFYRLVNKFKSSS